MKVQIIQIAITILTLTALPVVVHSAPMPKNSAIGVAIERVGGMTHIEFSGKNEWFYDLKKDGTVVSLTLPVIADSQVDILRKFTSLLVEKIEVDTQVSNKTQVKIHLSDKRIQNFDYLTQEPSRLVLDLFVEDDELLSQIRKSKEEKMMAKDKPKEVIKKISKKGATKKTPDRNPAFAEFFVTDAAGSPSPPLSADQNRPGQITKPLPTEPISLDKLLGFGSLANRSLRDESLEEKVLEANGNIYLRFPLLKLENRHLRELQSFVPEYVIKKSFSDENKQARKLLQMFNQRSFASFIKGKKLFKKTFPTSKYDELLSYMEADSWVELWKSNKRSEYLVKAMDIYKMLIERYPNSKISERTLIYAGLLAHDVGEYFVATKMLRRYLEYYPQSPFNNHIRVYLGDSLAHLNNFDAAREVLDKVREDAEKDTAAEALYRLGDIYFLKQSYRRAESAYNQALEKYPRYAEKFPNAIFNKAEALFNLAEYPASLEAYTEFYKKYPNHPYTAYALTRVGELIDLLYDDKHKAQGFYNESFFRFRNHMGGTIARMRSLSQRFKDMSDKELKTAIKEIKEREKAIDLHQVDEFSAFMISDGYYERGDFLQAANTLINYFQINPKPVNIKKFEKRISRAIAGEISENLREGKVVEAIEIIENHQKSWLSKSRRVDVQLFRAMAYEKMKLYDEALESYNRIEKRMVSLKGTKEELERKVFEYYPSFDRVRLRQAVVQYEMGQHKQSLDLLKKVENIGQLDPQSKIDFNYTLSRLSYDNKQYDEALKTALIVDRDQIIDPEKREKFSVFLSEVYEKNQMFDKSLEILEKFYEKFKGEQDQVYILSRLFGLYRSKGMKEKAIETGQNLLTEYDAKYDLDKERYYLGELLFNQNQPREAQKIWKELTKKSMWSELAKNKQVSGDWKKETESKINRIPAMAK